MLMFQFVNVVQEIIAFVELPFNTEEFTSTDARAKEKRTMFIGVGGLDTEFERECAVGARQICLFQ